MEFQYIEINERFLYMGHTFCKTTPEKAKPLSFIGLDKPIHPTTVVKPLD